MCVTGPRCCAEGRMAHKKMGQASFVEAFLRPDVGANRRLERIDEMIDWAQLERLVKSVRSGAWGRPSYPPLAMAEGPVFAALVLSVRRGGGGGAVGSAVVPAV